MSELINLFSQLEEYENEIIATRRHLHKYPELSFQEKDTSRFIAEQLRKLNIDVREQVGGNGIVGVIRGEKPGKTIAFRADFDALPIQEDTDHEYRSQNDGVMHACGHDGHTASLLGFAKVLQQNRHLLNGNIVLIHQHAEEKPPGGAKFMVEDGALKGVDKVFGAHLATELPVGTIASRPGPMMASVDHFSLKLIGRGGHGAYPHETVDTIAIGSQLISHLQQIVSRRISPIDPAVVTVGKFHAGTAFNIIADQAEIEGTVRSLSDEVRKKIENEIRAILDGVKTSDGIEYELEYLHGYPVLVNDTNEVEIVQQIVENNSTYNYLETDPVLGAEDFAYYLQHVPGAFFNVGARNPEDPNTHFPHHHPKFNFDEKALVDISKIFICIAHHYLIDRK